MNGSTAPARKKMTHTQRELSLTHKANSEEQPQTQKPAANRPAEVPSWANPHEHDTRRDTPGRSSALGNGSPSLSPAPLERELQD